MKGNSNSNTEIGQVVVNAKVTDQINYDDSVIQKDRSRLNIDALKKELSQLADELKRTKSDVDYVIHDEINAMKNYVTHALTRDRLAKRP